MNCNCQQVQSNNPTVFPLLLNLGMIVDGASFPSTNSSCQTMPNNEQHTVWYSLPKGHGFLGMNIHPGQVYLFIHVLMDSSKQLTQLGKLFHHVSIPCLQHVPHLPEVIPEGLWVTCCNGKCLQDHFESLAGHECTQSHWCSNKTINLTQRPKF